MTIKKIAFFFIIAGLYAFNSKVQAQEAKGSTVIKINANEVISKVSPSFYGLMTEEINYAYDGGLYAELIRNRSFKDNNSTPEHWSLIKDNEAEGGISLDSIEQKNTALTKNLRLEIKDTKGRTGISNDGFWGIPVKPGTKYRASFYAKAAKGFKGTLMVSIESNDGKTMIAGAEVKAVTQDWKKYTFILTTGKISPSLTNRFTITTKAKGTVWFSLVSLFQPTYNNHPNGNRTDIMKLLANMKPSFLRFPGGNYLQGKTLATRFDWKQTLGDISQRPTHFDDSWNYHSSDGMGLLEFMNWCEDLKMEPVLAVFAGFTLRSPNPLVGDSLTYYVQDALDEIEYLTGNTGTKWGAVRVKNGHPQPFKLNYVEIGNEDYFDRKKTSDARFTPFYDAIKAKYPSINVIASAPVTSRVPDFEDIHHYFPFKKALTLAHNYDNYKRTKAKVFEGEWACREGAPTTNFKGALGDAAFLTGLERNADLVKMSCYAPLFVNVNPGGMQWRSDLIGYDALNSYGSPSYYMQKTFSKYIGDELVSSSISGVPMAADTTEQLFYSVTKDSRKGTLFLKVVNVSETAHDVTIDINSTKSVLQEGMATLLTAKSDDTNSIAEPFKVVPVTSKVAGLGKKFTYTFKPNSITVLQLDAR